MKPPPEPLAVLPSFTNVPLAAVELKKNRVMPLPESKPMPPPLRIAPLLATVALAAVALMANAVSPPWAPLTVAALLVKLAFAAVAVSLKFVRRLIASELATNGAPVIDKDPVTRGRTVVE